MSENILISKIKKALSASGPATCSQIAAAINAEPKDVISVLREAVDREALAEKNGFYDFNRKANESFRKPYIWIEGRTVPAWVIRLAHGPRTCETVDVVAELSKAKQEQGWPPFVLAHIDVRLGRFICNSTSEIIDLHVLRYMPLDTSVVRVL